MASPLKIQFGKYELIERIAAGGMAEIFRARFSPAPGVVKPVVIKKILPHYAANRSFIGMFTNEARIVMGLSHGNIAQVFDFGDVEGDWFLAMELVDGQPLSKVVKRMRALGIHTLPPEFAAYLIAETLKGLHYAHTRLDEQSRPLHIVHRDVSPQNVLCSYEGQIKIVDFGIARARNAGREDTTTNAVKGKYAYFAPEQARGKSLDARTDVFATGVVLYELLTGQLPFRGRMMEVLTKIVRGQFIRPSELNPAIPPPLEAMILKAMALEANDRYLTAELFAQELTRYLAVHHPDFTPTDFSHFLGLLFETELVQSGRPLLLPPAFVERAQRWRSGVPIPEPAPEAPLPPGENPEEEVATGLFRVVEQPASEEPPPAQQTGAHGAVRFPTGELLEAAKLRRAGIPWSRVVGLTAAAASFGFIAVFLAVRLSRGTLEISSTPPGATVWVDGKQMDSRTPLQVGKLAAGQTYSVDIGLDGYMTWSNQVPLRRGQTLVIEATLQEIPPPPPNPPAPEPIIAEPVVVPKPPPAPDVVNWPTPQFELDVARHRIDLKSTNAFSLRLDEKTTYKISLNKGPSLGWGYYAVNATGATPGALPSTPQHIRDVNKLFVFKLPTRLLTGSASGEETKRRVLSIESKGKPKTHKLPLSLEVAPTAHVSLMGLDARAQYQVVVRQSSLSPARRRASGVLVDRCIIGHPKAGLLVAELDQRVPISGATQLMFTVVGETLADQEGRLIIEVKQVKKTSAPR